MNGLAAGADRSRADASAPGLDEAARVRLAAREDTPARMLERLAGDPAVTVRAAVALNTASSGAVNRLLAMDRDERVRLLLARRAAQLAPMLDAEGQEKLRGRIAGALAVLVEDEVGRVRAAIADVVKTMPDAPRELILRLARDSVVGVSEPVLRLSPLLTEDDLLALLAAPPHSVAAVAIACRVGLSPAVCDAVAATADTGAIRALLSNPTAAIREATLDALVEQAAYHAGWHEPLVRHTALSARNARILADIVASELLAVLAARTDLGAAVVQELRRKLADRLAASAVTVSPASDEGAMDEARRLDEAEGLDEAALLGAAERGNGRLTAAMLAVAASVPLALVQRAILLRTAKGIVSLVWRAGFTMRIAESLQASLADLGPHEVLQPGPNGKFPLLVEEMRWQLGLLGRPTEGFAGLPVRASTPGSEYRSHPL